MDVWMPGDGLSLQSWLNTRQDSKCVRYFCGVAPRDILAGTDYVGSIINAKAARWCFFAS